MVKEEHKLEGSISIQNTMEALLKLGDHQDFNFGDIVYKQNEPSRGLVYFQEGKIKLYTSFPDGMKRTICMVGAPHILGETSVIDGGTNICTAIALAKTKIVFIPREKMQAILLSNPNFMHMIMSDLAKKIRYMQLQVEDAAFRLPQRLARLLLCYNDYMKFPREEHELTLIVTHNELASCLGTTRPKVTEHLNEFYKHGLIEKGKGFIRIKDYEGLEHISGKFINA
ncbi:MAG TPA: Crp/Fnr family transcriptional regulator [Clostridium sp.]|uniref:Crp/Fnr family transcriptional regulator n=1 Tax=Clostridium sp. TaxID=1506 RepID=UPI002F930D10